jgi:hypothetical protein
MQEAGMDAASPAVAALVASLQLLEHDIAGLRAQRTAALPASVLADRAVRDRDAQMAKTKKTAHLLAKTDELLTKLQARKLELTRQLAEQQTKSDRLAAEASILAARVAAEALAPSQATFAPPPAPPHSGGGMENANSDDPYLEELAALDELMATADAEGSSGVARKPSGDSILPAAKRRESGSGLLSPTAKDAEIGL